MIKSGLKFAAVSVLPLLWAATGTVAKTVDGGDLFKKRCAACHQLPDPAKPPPEGWEGRLKMMAPLARLNGKQKEAVLGYLIDHSQAKSKETALNDDKLLFESKCSQCHTTRRVFIEPLNDESLSHIVERMQAKDSAVEISDQEAGRILNYLQAQKLDGESPEVLPENATAEELFSSRCLVCHSRERITQRMANSAKEGADWTHVVSRMRSKAPQWIADDEAHAIVEYLRSSRAGNVDQ